MKSGRGEPLMGFSEPNHWRLGGSSPLVLPVELYLGLSWYFNICYFKHYIQSNLKVFKLEMNICKSGRVNFLTNKRQWHHSMIFISSCFGSFPWISSKFPFIWIAAYHIASVIPFLFRLINGLDITSKEIWLLKTISSYLDWLWPDQQPQQGQGCSYRTTGKILEYTYN